MTSLGALQKGKKKSSVSRASEAFQVIGKCFDLYHLKHAVAF